jgi:hypothetical protein
MKSNSYIFFGFNEFDHHVRHVVMPNNQFNISHLVLKTAWEDENYSFDGVQNASVLQQALQLDSYYAMMVRGSCVRVPLSPDIWCPHNEMEHTEFETQRFFHVMWEVRTIIDSFVLFIHCNF